MKQLSKSEIAQRDALVKELETAALALEDAVTSASAAIADAVNAANAAVAAYNEVIDRANGFRNDLFSAMDEYAGQRSEKWEESEAGQAFASWKDEWEGDFDTVDEFSIDPLDNPECNAAGELSELPTEPA